MKAKILIGLFITLISPIQKIKAQSYEHLLPSWEMGISSGAYIYQGDLTPNAIGSFKTIKPGVQVTAGTYLTNSIAIRLGLAAASIAGNDARYGNVQPYRSSRNFYFNTGLVELTALGVFYFSKSRYTDQAFHPYIGTGAGFSLLHVKSHSSDIALSQFPSSDFPTRIAEDIKFNNLHSLFHIPVVIGATYDLNSSVSVQFEGMYRLSATDYLDGFSIAANKNKNDFYYSINAGFVFKWPDYGLNTISRRKLRCYAL